jgi:hypothetical protein
VESYARRVLTNAHIDDRRRRSSTEVSIAILPGDGPATVEGPRSCGGLIGVFGSGLRPDRVPPMARWPLSM